MEINLLLLAISLHGPKLKCYKGLQKGSKGFTNTQLNTGIVLCYLVAVGYGNWISLISHVSVPYSCSTIIRPSKAVVSSVGSGTYQFG